MKILLTTESDTINGIKMLDGFNQRDNEHFIYFDSSELLTILCDLSKIHLFGCIIKNFPEIKPKERFRDFMYLREIELVQGSEESEQYFTSIQITQTKQIILKERRSLYDVDTYAYLLNRKALEVCERFVCFFIQNKYNEISSFFLQNISQELRNNVLCRICEDLNVDILTLNFLVEHGCKPCSLCAYRATESGNLETVKFLMNVSLYI